MIFLDQSTILSQIVETNYQLIPVINRFGIRLGLGDKSITEICKEKNIEIDFFLAILNTYLNEDFFPEKSLQKIDIDLILNYLKKVDSFLIHGPLHNIEKHLNAFVAMSDPSNTQLALINKLFIKFKNEFISLVDKAQIEKEIPVALLVDLKNIIIKHLTGNFNDNMCYAVIFSVDSLQHDLEKHNRIREKILKPMINNLVEAGIEDWQSILMSEKEKPKADKSQAISLRELDVLRLVAQGFMNKEIADKLNISMHTVLSHRKNITAKLGIKTVSGLIFYCISNGHISADEIEI